MIYVLEDDASILELILYALKSQNLQAKGFQNVESFKKELQNPPDILILDIMLGNDDGFEVLKSIKKNPKTEKINVLILTALGNEIEKLKGFDLGAEDYMTKPFGVLELLARIRVMLKRLPQNEEIVELKDLVLNKKQHFIKINNENIGLTLKEFELLAFLLENKKRLFNREELLSYLWRYSPNAETRTVDAHIKTLRKKLGTWAENIETIHGIGYKIKE